MKNGCAWLLYIDLNHSINLRVNTAQHKKIEKYIYSPGLLIIIYCSSKQNICNLYFVTI